MASLSREFKDGFSSLNNLRLHFGPKLTFIEKPKETSVAEGQKNQKSTMDSSDYCLNLGGVFGAGELTRVPKTEDVLHEVYLGCGRAKEMERKLKKLQTFGLYHRENDCSVEILKTLKLFLIHRMADGSYKHFPIDMRHQDGKDCYFVDGAEDSKTFPSLTALVKFYKTYGQLTKDEKF